MGRASFATHLIQWGVSTTTTQDSRGSGAGEEPRTHPRQRQGAISGYDPVSTAPLVVPATGHRLACRDALRRPSTGRAPSHGAPRSVACRHCHARRAGAAGRRQPLDSVWEGGDGREETGSSARKGTGGNLGRENGLIFHWKQGIGKRETGNGNWEMGNGSYFGQL